VLVEFSLCLFILSTSIDEIILILFSAYRPTVIRVAYCRQIWQNYVNMRSDFFVVDNSTFRKLKDFYAAQDKWTRSMIKNHLRDEDSFWRHVAYTTARFDGLYSGYKAVALPEWVRRLS